MPRKKVTEEISEEKIKTEPVAQRQPEEAEASESVAEEQAEHKETPKEERPEVEGILEIQEENNFGFLRFSNFLTSEKDIYVSPTQIRRFNLKTGDKIRGITRLPKEGERFGALLYVVTVNGDEPGVAIRRPDFDDLTPVFPYERLRLEDGSRELSTRSSWGMPMPVSATVRAALSPQRLTSTVTLPLGTLYLMALSQRL